MRTSHVPLICAWLLGLCVAAMALVGRAQPVATDQALRGTIRVLEIRGTITPALVPQMRKVLEDIDPNRLPAGALLLLDSSGGDGLAAMEMGRIARAAGVHAFVVGHCNSACVFILAGAVVRGVANDQAVAIHRGRITVTASGANVSTASNPEAALALEVADHLSEEYLREMNLPETLFKAMMAVPANLSRFLTLAEMADLHLTGSDPVWSHAHVPAGAAAYGISPEEFERRMQRVPASCIPGKPTPQEFTRCYRRIMQAGA